MSIFSSPAFEGHEGVHAFFDPASGLRCFIAIHSTVRGPAAGGCRMWSYASDQAALDDALRLSRAMTYKNAIVGIDHGGGKAVIIGDSRRKTPAMFEAFGRAVDGLRGRYWAAEDVGLSPADLAHAATQTKYVAGLEGRPSSSGDPSLVTAEGVLRGMRVAVRKALGRDLDGVTVALQGVGHVGAVLADKLHAAGAKLIIADVNAEAAQAVAERTGAAVVAPEAIFDAEAEVFSPCALGGAISRETLPRLNARVIAGGANNQLADAQVGRALFERGVVYAPDFAVNGGGIINVAAEIRAVERAEAYDSAWVEAKVAAMVETLAEVLDRSAAEKRPAEEVAMELAKARIVASSSPAGEGR